MTDVLVWNLHSGWELRVLTLPVILTHTAVIWWPNYMAGDLYFCFEKFPFIVFVFDFVINNIIFIATSLQKAMDSFSTNRYSMFVSYQDSV